MRPAAEFLIYACEGCGKRVFAERGQLGRSGLCPCCGRRHVVGGTSVAEEGRDQRAAPRITAEGARVALRTKGRGARPGGETGSDALFALGDLSETGLSFKVPAARERRQLSGLSPAPVRVGDVVHVALMGPSLRARAFAAEVRRVELGSGPPQLWTVGARFVGLDAARREELRALVDQLSD